MSKVLGVIFLIIVVFVLLGSCSRSNSRSSYTSSSSYNGYSQTYKNDAGYRKNVNDIANVYGEDPKKVDSVINALSDAISK